MQPFKLQLDFCYCGKVLKMLSPDAHMEGTSQDVKRLRKCDVTLYTLGSPIYSTTTKIVGGGGGGGKFFP